MIALILATMLTAAPPTQTPWAMSEEEYVRRYESSLDLSSDYMAEDDGCGEIHVREYTFGVPAQSASYFFSNHAGLVAVSYLDFNIRVTNRDVNSNVLNAIQSKYAVKCLKDNGYNYICSGERFSVAIKRRNYDANYATISVINWSVMQRHNRGSERCLADQLP